MQSVFRWPIESCVMSVYRSWSWTFFSSCSDIAFEVVFCYRSIGKTLLTSKNGNVHATKRFKKPLRSSMNSALLKIWDLRSRSEESRLYFSFTSAYSVGFVVLSKVVTSSGWEYVITLVMRFSEGQIEKFHAYFLYWI